MPTACSRAPAARGYPLPFLSPCGPHVARNAARKGHGDMYVSSTWPVTFEYPGAWQVSDVDDSLIFDCPDPIKLIWGGVDIRMKRGTGTGERVNTPRGPGVEFEKFFLLGRDWFAGDSCRKEADPLNPFPCLRARQSTTNGMTVIQSELPMESRRGGVIGYLGQGAPPVQYLFLRQDAWVIVRGAPDESADSFPEGPGPVLFDGDGILQRIVRSIRPR